MSDNKQSSSAEQQQKEELKKKLAESATRSTAHPRTVSEVGVNVLRNLPANINMIQNFMKVINWKQAQAEVLEGLNNTVVIVGQPNTGKSTLFNKIKGQELSPASAQAGTTRTLVRTDFGPFTLVDTPGHIPSLMESGMEQASVIVLLIDATRGLQVQDRELYEAIKKLNKPIVVAVNKVDALAGSETGDRFATEVAVQLEAYGVIPVSARTGENVAEELIPAIIEASPEAALAIGRELPTYRNQAAQRIIRNATLVALAAGLEPIPFVDIPILLGTQVRLVLRLAALYGEPLNSADAMLHARELVATIAGGLGLRLLAEQAAKAVPFGGDFVAGAIAGAATWSIGQVALEYYEGGRRFGPRRLQGLFNNFYRRFRKEKLAEKLQAEEARASAEAIEERQSIELPEKPQEKIQEEEKA
ncbi:MAG: GTP-binding protein [Ktedonobacteraceae bacterium]|nr:GTP-binding protein [Ktedonobacteraceae bacterium]